jgi:two-component system sensor histidine kinase DegS
MPEKNTGPQKKRRAGFARGYRQGLRLHLARGGVQGLVVARRLGRRALAAGMEILDLAVTHEQALVCLPALPAAAPARDRVLRRAGRFFTEALGPLAAERRAARHSVSQLNARNRLLRVHAAELARGNRRLGDEMARRAAGQALLRRSSARNRVLLAEAQTMHRKLRHLAHQILTAQEEERKMISRELHDEVVQTLVGINVELSTLAKGASVGLRGLKAKIARTQRLVEHSVKAVHRFARELRPAALDDLGLIPALHAYCRTLAARNGLRIDLTAFAGVESIGGAERTTLFRVAQEALTNVVRHAHAAHVRLDIREVPGAIRMEIADDGRSFSVKKALQARTNKRLGLIGMSERLEMLGGRLELESAPGRGTVVRAEIPFLPPRKV